MHGSRDITIAYIEIVRAYQFTVVFAALTVVVVIVVVVILAAAATAAIVSI